MMGRSKVSQIRKFICSRNGWISFVTAMYFICVALGYWWANSSGDALDKYFKNRFVMNESIIMVLFVLVLYLSNPWFRKGN